MNILSFWKQSMSYRSLIVLLVLVVLCLMTSYGLRFALMEDGQWVGVCAEQAARWQCQLREQLGWLINFRVIAWMALGLAALGFILPRQSGWLIAALGLCCAIPALVLYSASLAVFAVVLSGLRLVRSPVSA
jgi:hypothetical protein